MFDQLCDNVVRHRPDVRAHQRRFDNMHRVADTGDEHLRIESIIMVDRQDLLDQCHTIGADIIEPADKRADDICACLRGEKRLIRRKT